MQHRDFIIINKIVDELNVVIDAVGEMSFDEFDSQEMFKRGVCMTVINVGELVKNLSDDFRNEYSHIPWKDIAGFRDIAAHKYQTLNMKDVYSTIMNDFPELKGNIIQIIDKK
ncbi:MAG: DUF86 domain-containing protein [Clostridia bacterium]|nr:DUF86 domain-containing protein [Clostridia bacterium]